MESPSTARDHSSHPKHDDAGHRAYLCNKEILGSLAGCAPLRHVRLSIRKTSITSATPARTVRLSSESSLGSNAEGWRVARAPENMRIRLRCSPRTAPLGLDCPAPSTDQAKSAASGSAVAFHLRCTAGAFATAPHTMELHTSEQATTRPQKVATCS